MTKTLSVSIPDSEKLEQITVSGTLDNENFNKNVVLSIGSMRVTLDSEQLASALKEVVDFQLNTRQATFLIPKSGISIEQ